MPTRPAPARSSSVSDDWCTPLPSDKAAVYELLSHRLETSYSIFSITLNETLGLARDRSHSALQILVVAIPLCERLARSQVACLRAMLAHGRHFGITPNLALLDPENFHTEKGKKVASFNSLLGQVLLTRRSQFLTKIETLADLTEDLATGFQAAATKLIALDAITRSSSWEFLDATHYDLNTCLRETVVVLKSFLHALPMQQLSQFQERVREESAVSPLSAHSSDAHLAHRRMAAIKGQ